MAEGTLDLLMLRRDGVDPTQWPRLSCSQAQQAALTGADLRLDAGREVLFQDQGQIRAADDAHRLVFDRAAGLLELHEQGAIRFLTGGPAPSERLRILATGQVGLGTPTPTQALEVVGTVRATAFAGDGGALTGVRDDTKVLKAGDTMTGPLALTAAGTGLSVTQNAAVGGTLTVTGNLGLGTTNPTVKLDIAQNTALRVGNAYMSSGGVQYAHFASNAWYNGSAWQIPNPSRRSGLLQFVDGDVYFYHTLTAGAANWNNVVNITSSGMAVPTAQLSFGALTRQMINLWSTGYGIGVQGGTQYYRTGQNFAWFLGGSHNDNPTNPGGGTRLMALNSWGDLILSARTNPGANPNGSLCRALVDAGNTLMINYDGDYPNGVQISSNLRLTGAAFKPGGGSWGNTSDVRLKRHVRPLAGALDLLLRLRGICFEWKEPGKQGNLTGPQMGMLAHEVEEVFPEWISTDPEGYQQLTIRGFEALVVEALRTLKATQDQIEGQNQAFETRLGQLEAKPQTEL